ncbi:hypothetical protein DFP72DRAFT_1075310 [Ephemerocybe angulata]|uniref:Uncharacterized protein n=1 Tax=Ephemerocybe angulata TaxID=980116 RepID=A0A8H6HIK8_9AGAR|nr:hypothetical protein DFP72DRAFT_1075310 [Tulosesus angulatus]
MDSFTTISINTPTVSVPSDNETNKQGSGGYCVVFAKDIPTNEETNKQGSDMSD